jgi:hypothetical protein
MSTSLAMMAGTTLGGLHRDLAAVHKGMVRYGGPHKEAVFWLQQPGAMRYAQVDVGMDSRESGVRIDAINQDSKRSESGAGGEAGGSAGTGQELRHSKRRGKLHSYSTQ